MRAFLDRLYAAALWCAAACFALIAALVLAQVAGRLIDNAMRVAGRAPLGLAVPSLAEIGGFLFVAAVSLGMAATLREAGHVRVTMLGRALGPKAGHWLVVLVLVAGTGLALFACINSGLQAYDSWAFSSVSFGMVRVPLWIPQAAMTLGLAIFALALVDETLAALRGLDPAFRRAEAAKEASGATDGH